jgi:hypothetical protein
MHWVPGRPESAPMANPPNAAQAYRSIGAKDGFLTRFRRQCGEPLGGTVVPA